MGRRCVLALVLLLALAARGACDLRCELADREDYAGHRRRLQGVREVGSKSK